MTNETKRIAVVGAGGFLGTTVLERAATRSSIEVVAVVRSARSLPMILGRCSDIVVTGERDDKLIEGFSGVDGVIDVSVGAAPDIAASARMIAAACKKAGVERLVYTSTAAAQAIRRRAWEAAKPTSLYGREKAIAEQELSTLRPSIAVTIVRPGLVWGPRSSWTIQHLDALQRGAFIVPAARSGSAPNLAFAPNLADALLNAATAEPAVDRDVDFADAWWASWEDYARTVAAAIGVEDRVRVATRLRPGPWKAIAVETVAQHPWLKGAAGGILRRAPSFFTAAVRARLKAPKPPAHIPPFAASELLAESTVAKLKQADLDVFKRWRSPESGQELLEPIGTPDRHTAVALTVAWARDAGFVPQLQSDHA